LSSILAQTRAQHRHVDAGLRQHRTRAAALLVQQGHQHMHRFDHVVVAPTASDCASLSACWKREVSLSMRMEPRFGGAGVILNLRVDQVDALYSRLSRAALPMGLPLEDHPWGDRGFSTFDPSGLELYCYTPSATEAPFQDALRRPWVLD
jgi:hypothetical protein